MHPYEMAQMVLPLLFTLTANGSIDFELTEMVAVCLSFYVAAETDNCERLSYVAAYSVTLCAFIMWNRRSNTKNQNCVEFHLYDSMPFSSKKMSKKGEYPVLISFEIKIYDNTVQISN